MKIKRHIIIILLFWVLTPLYSIAAEAVTKERSKVYSENIRKLESKIAEIEKHVIMHGIKDFFENYPKYFKRSVQDGGYLIDYLIYEDGRNFLRRTKLKFEIIECGKINEKYKYLKCNIWMRETIIFDELFEKANFADYTKADDEYIICDNMFANVIGAYDSLESFKILEDIKKLKDTRKVSVYFNEYIDRYRALNNQWYYRRDLKKEEIKLLTDYITNIDYKYSQEIKIDPTNYIKLDKKRPFKDGFYRYYPNVKLVMEYNEFLYEIYLIVSFSSSAQKRFIQFENYDYITRYKYDNKLFFNLYTDYYIKANEYDYAIFWPDNCLQNKGYPDYLFQALPNESQEVLCEVKMKKLLFEIDGEKKIKNCVPVKWNSQQIKEKTEYYKNRINANFYWAKIYVNEFASAGCLILHCPSNRNAKYEYKIRIGTVEITCPIHGCKKIPWQ